MVTLSQRIEALRTEKGLSRSDLAATLGFPKTSIEKFETGRQTPTREQQEKLAAFFDVSPFYLRGESNDRTKMEQWINGNYSAFTDPVIQQTPRHSAHHISQTETLGTPSSNGGNSVFDAFLHSKSFQENIRSTLLDVLRSPEGQRILSDVLSKVKAGTK